MCTFTVHIFYSPYKLNEEKFLLHFIYTSMNSVNKIIRFENLDSEPTKRKIMKIQIINETCNILNLRQKFKNAVVINPSAN